MRAIDALIVWTPDREPWKGQRFAGRVAVTTIDHADDFRDYPMSVGACDFHYLETDDAGRLQLIQQVYSPMIHRDGITAEAIQSALSCIDEFRDHQFSPEMSEPPDDGDEHRT
jgi:hypothetical protein